MRFHDKKKKKKRLKLKKKNEPNPVKEALKAIQEYMQVSMAARCLSGYKYIIETRYIIIHVHTYDVLCSWIFF